MSGTKKLFMMTQRASALNAEGRVYDEIVDIIADEWCINRQLSESVVKSWWDGKVSKSFNWEEEVEISGY